MTEAQEQEFKRMTHLMQCVLCYAAKMTGIPDAPVFGPMMRSARILQRRGFVSLSDRGVRLTEAGREAFERMGWPD